MNAILIIVLILGHWVSDYVFQSTQKISFKGKNNKLLINHSIEYTSSMTGFIILALLFNVLSQNLWYYIINFWIIIFTLHYIVDYFTSKLSIKTWNENNKADYFSIIITDQMFHLIILFITVNYLFY